MSNSIRIIAIVLLIAGVRQVAYAVPPNVGNPISPQVRDAAARCLRLTLACQLDDGAIVQVAHAGADGPVLIVPYFGHYVALSWIVHHRYFRDPKSLSAAQKWLQWCATHQEKGGYWNHWEGTRRRYANLNVCDAWDSSAALYLLVLDRFLLEGGKTSPEMISAAQRSLECLERLVDASGLTLAKSDYPVMFLMDNIESAAGARAATELFTRLDKLPERRRAAMLRTRISDALPSYWDRPKAIYAWARHPSGQVDVRLTNGYPDALAQLFAVAHLSANTELFDKLVARFRPDDGPMAAVGVERWYMAATALGGERADRWRGKLLEAINLFRVDVYSYRPAVATLALLEGGATLSPDPLR